MSNDNESLAAFEAWWPSHKPTKPFDYKEDVRDGFANGWQAREELAKVECNSNKKYLAHIITGIAGSKRWYCSICGVNRCDLQMQKGECMSQQQESIVDGLRKVEEALRPFRPGSLVMIDGPNALFPQENLTGLAHVAALIPSLIDRAEQMEGALPIVRLDKYYPKLSDEAEVELFISEDHFTSARKVRGGFIVNIIAINCAKENGHA